MCDQNSNRLIPSIRYCELGPLTCHFWRKSQKSRRTSIIQEIVKWCHVWPDWQKTDWVCNLWETVNLGHQQIRCAENHRRQVVLLVKFTECVYVCRGLGPEEIEDCEFVSLISHVLMASSNGNISALTDPMWGESISRQWIPLTEASDAEL